MSQMQFFMFTDGLSALSSPSFLASLASLLPTDMCIPTI